MTSSFSLRTAVAPILAFLLGLAACAGAAAEQLPLRSYGIQDGLASDSVIGILRDSRGYLWFATTDGVSRFDGERFSSYGVENGLPQARAEQVLETRDGTIWVATRGGLARYIPGRKAGQPAFAAVPWRGQSPGAPVYALHEDGMGRLWVGGADRLTCLTAGQPRDVPLAGLARPAGRISSFAETADGSLWIGSEGGLLRLLPKDFSLAYAAQPSSGDPVLGLAVDSTGRLWIAHASGVLALRPASGDISNISNIASRRIFAARDGRVWLATGQGLAVWDAARGLTSWTTDNGLPEPAITAVAEDRAGNLWLGTGSSGALRLARRGLTGFTARDGLSGEVTALFIASDGSLAARSGNTLQRFDGARFTGLRQPAVLNPREPAVEDASGAVWTGLAGGGLARARGGRSEPVRTTPELPPGPVRDLFLDHAGRLWVAIEDGGAGRLDSLDAPQPRLTLYTERSGLSSAGVRCITEDAQGHIYLGGRKGIDRLDPATGRIVRFTTADGLLDNVVDSALRDRAGNLWFGTRRGLSRLVPAGDTPAPPPATWITAVRVDGVARVVSELGAPSVSGPDLEAESRLEVESLALDFMPGAALRYQHRMVGVDADWSEPAAARVVQYAELPEGWQRFEVRAVTRDGASGTPGVVIFHVEPPLWRRGWVLALTALGVTAAGIGFYWYRSSHQVALERMRTRIATDLHDDLGSSLTRVSILSEVARRRVADDSESSRLLNEIGVAAREMIEALGESIWAIDPRRDDLRSFVTRVRRFAGGLLDGSGIAWHLRAPQDGEQIKLSPVERRQLYLLVKEALHNATRHSQATTVDIQFAVTGRRLSVEIRDDGRGFDPSGPESGGHGLGSLRARAAALGARLVIDTAPGRGTRLFLEARLPTVGA